MIRWLRKSTGIYRVRLTTADPGGALTYYTDKGFLLRNPVLETPVTLTFDLPAGRAEALRQMAEKRGECCEMTGERGPHRLVAKLWSRKWFVCLLAAIVLFSLYGVKRVWFVRVQGNEEIPDEDIVAAAEMCGVSFWRKISDIRSETVKNQLLNQIPELQWAGVNFQGGVAVISVRERLQKPEIQKTEPAADLVAAKDGIVVSMSILRGQSLCKPGQAVTAGETLVTGSIEHEYQTQFARAEGEVYALTQTRLTAICPRFVNQKEYTGGERYCVSILLGRKKIKIYGNSGILDTTCDKMTTVKTLTLPGDYPLPVSLIIEEYRPYETKQVESTDATPCARRAMEQSVFSGMLAGEIVDSVVAGSEEASYYKFYGIYLCREMIARQRETARFEGEENAYDRTNCERGAGGGSD